jgi:hypothetical protein
MCNFIKFNIHEETKQAEFKAINFSHKLIVLVTINTILDLIFVGH